MVVFLPKPCFSLEKLGEFAESGWGGVSFDKLDRATREAIHTRIIGTSFMLHKMLGEEYATPNSLAQEVGSNYLDGYALGRLLVGTVNGRLSYSGNIEDASVKCSQLCAKANEFHEDDIINWAGQDVHKFLLFNCDFQSKHGSYADIADEGIAFRQVCSAFSDGLRIAVAEHLLFASTK